MKKQKINELINEFNIESPTTLGFKELRGIDLQGFTEQSLREFVDRLHWELGKHTGEQTTIDLHSDVVSFHDKLMDNLTDEERAKIYPILRIVDLLELITGNSY